MSATRPPAPRSCATCSRLFAELAAGGLAVAHNGNLTNGLTLRRELIADGAICQSTSDTEVVLLLTARSRKAEHRRSLSSRRSGGSRAPTPWWR